MSKGTEKWLGQGVPEGACPRKSEGSSNGNGLACESLECQMQELEDLSESLGKYVQNDN